MDYREHGRHHAWRVAAVLLVALIAALCASSRASAATSFQTSFHFGAGARGPVTQHVFGPATGKIHYARNEQVCPRPKRADEMQCFAVISKPVAKGTVGAIAYRSPLTVRASASTNGIGTGPAGGYTPADLAAAYGYNPNLNRRSQLIVLVDWYNDPDARKDLDTFDSQYGLPKETSTSFRVLNQSGKASPLPISTGSAAIESSVEESLDIESARGVCHTCRLVLLEANGPATADLMAAENEAVKLGATEISNSYGGPEFSGDTSAVSAYNHPGVVITASTGDDGWYGWAYANDGDSSDNAAEFPATSPTVVAVGGTSLEINGTTGARTSETVWNDNGPDDEVYWEGGTPGGAGGGGCSQVFEAPAWQSHYSGYKAAGCNGGRLDADVAAIADPSTGFDIIDTDYQSNWLTVGGTSLASPVVAAMYALAGGSGGTAYPASTLYVNGTQRASAHYDVTKGGNGFCGGDTTYECGEAVASYSGDTTDNPNAWNPAGSGPEDNDCSFPLDGDSVSAVPALNPECNAVKGFDGPTGIGTPKGLGMFTPTNPTLKVSATGSGRTVTFKVRATEHSAGTRITGYKWSWGSSSTSTTSSSVKHTFKSAGTYGFTLTVSDSRYQATVEHFAVKVK